MMLMTKSGYTLRIALGRFAMMQESATIRGLGEGETSPMSAMHIGVIDDVYYFLCRLVECYQSDAG
jgi:hypothetical protein